ncbi:MAG TPA: hypothetical protein VK737_11735 [Opitutales bacterium]|jgi:hypothetical protein|nr:hypothetical protein [Opitutales bacterium]
MSSSVLPLSSPVWLVPLRALLAEVRSPQPGKEGLAKMMTVLAEIELLLTQHQAEIPPQLVHFLERRSYDKAIQYCDGEMAIPRGTCGPKN